MGPSLRLEGVPEHTTLSDVTILQQHCGGNTVYVFKARVKTQDGLVCVQGQGKGTRWTCVCSRAG